MKIKQFLLGLATASCFAMPAFAAQIEFKIDTISFSYMDPNAYGPGVNNQNQLDVRFEASSAPGSFFLDNATPATATRTFNVGTVQLREECINPSTCPTNGSDTRDETDNLDIFVTFHFLSPLNGDQKYTMKGTAVAGEVSDSDVDYTLTFAPKEYEFGNGGKFSLDLLDLSFTNFSSIDKQTLTATITLLNAPTNEGTGNDVPEPGSLALIGLGLAGLRVGAKRRKA